MSVLIPNVRKVAGEGAEIPLVSIIIPCRNAMHSISRCLESVVASDYPKERLEVLVVDGASKDGTIEILAQYMARHRYIVLLANPHQTQQKALNIGIRRARGEVIIRMDAHCSISTDYVSQCVHYLWSTNADNVGGRIATVPREPTLSGRAIAIAMSEPFGVGRSPFRVWKPTDTVSPRWVDSVPYSSYRRRVFETVGLFNEDLDRSEDAEFHQRMRRHGCRTLFVPTLVSRYYARSDLPSFATHAIDNGRWAILPSKYTRQLVVSMRHLIPLLSVVTCLGLTGLSLIHPMCLMPLLALVGTYGIANGLAAARIAHRERDWRLMGALPVVFAVLHLGYGWGSLMACVEVLYARLRGGFRRESHAVHRLDAGTAQLSVSMPLPRVSIIIPCRNEEQFIGSCLDSILANTYPKERLEIVVVDGMSEDNTRAILDQYRQHHAGIRCLDNPRREQPIALNIGITHATGDILMRMDAHTTYRHDYIAQAVYALQHYGADNVGGRWITVPRGTSLLGKAICFVTSVPFGSGNAYYRLASWRKGEPYLREPRWEINVAYFCCRKEVFQTVGLFNEQLDRSEDIDFRSRLKRAGFRTLFVPTIECYYAMRTRLPDFLRHMFRNGMWVLLPLNHAPEIAFSFRHIVPLLFVVSLFETICLAFHSVVFRSLLFGLIGTYLTANIYSSFRIAVRERDARYFFILPWLFTLLHLCYGTGSVVGLVRLIGAKVIRLYKRLLSRYFPHRKHAPLSS